MSDIVRRKESITQDFEKKTLNGFLGIFVHIFVLGFINLLLMGLIGSNIPALAGLARYVIIVYYTCVLFYVLYSTYLR